MACPASPANGRLGHNQSFLGCDRRPDRFWHALTLGIDASENEQDGTDTSDVTQTAAWVALVQSDASLAWHIADVSVDSGVFDNARVGAFCVRGLATFPNCIL